MNEKVDDGEQQASSLWFLDDSFWLGAARDIDLIDPARSYRSFAAGRLACPRIVIGTAHFYQ
jgi:hypothetical protein